MSGALGLTLSLAAALGLAAHARGGDATAGAPAVDLERHSWQLTEFADPEVAVAVGYEATLEFDAEQSTASGFAGCNRFSAAYERSADALSFGRVRSTMMACPDEPRTLQEAAFLAALDEVTGFAIDAEELRLLGAGGELLVTLRPRPSPSADEPGDQSR